MRANQRVYITNAKKLDKNDSDPFIAYFVIYSRRGKEGFRVLVRKIRVRTPTAIVSIAKSPGSNMSG